VDKIGVISFDESFDWVFRWDPRQISMRRASRLTRSWANGGTKIYQAVEAGFEAIVKEPASRRHIILLTDGVSTRARRKISRNSNAMPGEAGDDLHHRRRRLH